MNQNKEGEEILEKRTKVKIVKNKLAPPFKKAEFRHTFRSRYFQLCSNIDMGTDHEIIKKERLSVQLRIPDWYGKGVS
jgi:recombination protein RecA